MSLRFWLVLLLLVPLCVLAEEETATFRYAPALRVLSVSTTTTQHVINGKVVGTDVDETRLRSTAVRTEAGGFRETLTLIAATRRANGRSVEPGTYARVFKDIDVTVESSAEGKLLAITGLDRVAANAQAVLDADEQGMVGPMFTEKALRAAVTDDWQTEVATFVGRTVKVGDRWTVKGLYPLPTGGGAKETVTYTVTGFSDVKGTRCVHVTATIAVDPKAMGKAFAAFFTRMPRPEGMPAPEIVMTSQEITAEYDINPDTMEYLTKTRSEVVKFTASLKGAGSFQAEDRMTVEGHTEADTAWRATFTET